MIRDRLAAGIGLALAACDGGQNRAPVLVAVNGVDLPTGLELIFGGYPQDPAWEYAAGEPFVIDLEITDPDGDTVAVWWPYAPPGLTPDPAKHRLTWDVPAPAGDVTDTGGAAGAYWDVNVVLDDQRADDPRRVSYYLPLFPRAPEGGNTVVEPGRPRF